jgi:DNA-damage-inducible protein J
MKGEQMPKTAVVRARIEPELKREVESIFNEVGLSATEAITAFYRNVKLYRGIPFELRLPNKTTRKTFEDTDTARNLVRSKSSKEMFKRLGI